MSNVSPSSEPRKTTVKVGVTRLLNTAQYENVQVVLETTDEITWTSLEDRAQKTANLVTLLNQQFVKTQTQVLSDLGCQEKRAWRKEAAPAPKVTKTLVGDPLDA